MASDEIFQSAPCVKRYEGNPVLSADDVPYPATLVFNAGVCKFQGQYVMVFRNDVCSKEQPKKPHETNIGIAFSDDGMNWEVRPEPWIKMRTSEIRRAYDPRITVVEDKVYLCFAVDTNHGIRGGIAVTEDFDDYEVLHMTVPDNRNMVIFPEKIQGRLARLERPFPTYGRGSPEAFDLWFSDSYDGSYWGNSNLVLGSDQVPWCNNKIGPGAPPVKTDAGWLTLYHVVDKDENRPLSAWHANWCKRYTIGAMLLDLEEPWKVKAMSSKPILVPEDPYQYELEGFRGSVLFPGGLILEDNGEVKIYYGASDTVECLATADVNDLINLCDIPGPEPAS